MSPTIITSWLLTYLVHSTILLGAAWLVSRFLGENRLALQETLLRTALIGGLLTTTLQVGVGIEPIGGALAIDGLARPEAVTAVSARNDGVTMSVAAADISFSTPLTVSDRAGDFWPIVLLLLWGCGSLLALLVLGRSALDLRRLLNTRRFRPAGRLVEHLAAVMGLRRPVRLSTSAAITVPFATGIRQPEICCPERVCDLAIEHQTGLFAHELAHLARRDPVWQLLYRLGEAFLILQPLNRLVRRRLEEIAEHLTDERAVACTGDRLGLAQCLVVVAHWGTSSVLGVPATAFAAGPRLDRRVRRLLEGGAAAKMTPARITPLVVCLLAAAAFTLPVVSSVPAHAELTRAGSDAASIKTWSDADEAPSEVPPTPDQPAPAPAPAVSPASEAAPHSVAAPAPGVVPAPGVAPAPQAAPASEAAPVPMVAPAPAVAPASAAAPALRDEPAPPASPTAPKPPPRVDEPTPEDAAQSQSEGTSEETRNRRQELRRERSEAEARARERARFHSEESRAFAARARELARQAAEEGRLTDADYEKLRSEAREHVRAAAERLREMAEQSRQIAREAVQSARLTDADREEIRRRVEKLRTKARELAREAGREAGERSRDLSEKARRLAKEAEAERHAEEERRRLERIE
jgi:Zn-dependent protease with chaperone function